MYTSTPSLTSAPDGVGGQRHAPAALLPGKTRYRMYRMDGWASGMVWTGAENLAPTGIRSPNRPARRVAIPTTLSQPTLYRTVHYINTKMLVAM
jgi:hypothetical protein